MISEAYEFETWEEVIVDFLQRKADTEEEKYLKEVIKNVSEHYKKQNYFDNAEIETFFDAKKNSKDSSQLSLEFQQLKFKRMYDFDVKPNDLNQTELEEAYSRRCIEIAEKYDSHAWISKASNDAASVSFATHVIKLTHSKIDSSSIYDQIHSQKPGVLATSDLKEKIIDGAVAGNQFAPIFQFLELELKGDKLATIFADETNTILQQFTDNSDELELWNKGFKRALANNKLGSHFLAKQIYFPILQDNLQSAQTYHLLCHVKSSSLAHAIWQSLNENNQKTIRKKRDKKEYSISQTGSFPHKACIQVTASNHSNASQLNGKRGGRLHLFNSQPPSWKSQMKPPVSQISFFQGGVNYYQIKETVDYLRDFLLRFQRIDLSIKDPKRKKWIDSWTSQIIDKVMVYAASIQNLPAGWSRSENIRLKREHQCFLDPYRDDEKFQMLREATDWQTVICADFAGWLNGKLKGRDKQFTPQPEHTRMWKELMKKELREHEQVIDWDIKELNKGKQV